MLIRSSEFGNLIKFAPDMVDKEGWPFIDDEKVGAFKEFLELSFVHRLRRIVYLMFLITKEMFLITKDWRYDSHTDGCTNACIYHPFGVECLVFLERYALKIRVY